MALELENDCDCRQHYFFFLWPKMIGDEILKLNKANSYVRGYQA